MQQTDTPADPAASTTPPRVVGLTGGLASGKSTVGRLLRGLGAEVIDADEVARAIVAPGQPAYEKIVAAFGPEVLRQAPPDAAAAGPPPLDREKLAARVFSDEQARRQLNAITHPEVAAESARRIAAAAARGCRLVIYEAPLIVENQLHRGLDGVIVVDVPEPLQLTRAVSRGGLTHEQAAARLRAQVRRAERLAVANWVIDNSGSAADTAQQVAAVWADLQAGRKPAPRPETTAETATTTADADA